MKKLVLFTVCILSACASEPEALKDFESLLHITDVTSEKICTLPLADIRAQMSPQDLEAKKVEAFNFDDVIKRYANDPAKQIKVIFRRAALKRRFNVKDDATAQADDFYENLKTDGGTPITLKGFHDDLHYWMDRIGEQSQFGEPISAAYNLRFCVMNEKRAELHAASRKDILERVERGVILPAPQLIENINHETSFNDGFKKNLLKQIFSDEATSNLTPLARAKMRSDESFLPFDPNTADEFWQERDAEISAMTNFIQSHDFSYAADKLGYMTDIDQSLRKLWSGSKADEHFSTPEEFELFKKGISERVIKVDAFNTAELKKMLEGRAWFNDNVDGRGAANDAWLIAQHADQNPDFQITALKLIEADLDAPGVSKANYAYLYDRVQMRFDDSAKTSEKIQRYGTQGRCTGPGTWEPFPVESPDRIDEVRAEVGLGTMAEYKLRFKNICKEDQR